MISVVFDSKWNLDSFLSKIKLFSLAESLGGVESLMSVPYFMTHMQGIPQNMQNNPSYQNIATDITNFFRLFIFFKSGKIVLNSLICGVIILFSSKSL